MAHNPTSNLKLGAGVAPVARMLELGLDVGIGTDGAASNNDLDMFEETRLAALLAKGIGGDPTALPARDALAMATRGGARALHLSHLTGSLEPGKRADLIVLEVNRLHNVPAFEREPNAIYARIVYASKSTDVVDVLCNGRWLMRDRTLLTLREADSRGTGSRLRAKNRRVPREPRGERPPEAGGRRRRSGTGELRGPGEGTRADGSAGAEDHRERGPDGDSGEPAITSSTRIGRSTTSPRGGCGTGKTSSWTTAVT